MSGALLVRNVLTVGGGHPHLPDDTSPTQLKEHAFCASTAKRALEMDG